MYINSFQEKIHKIILICAKIVEKVPIKVHIKKTTSKKSTSKRPHQKSPHQTRFQLLYKEYSGNIDLFGSMQKSN